MNKWVCKTLKTPFMNYIIQPLPSLLAFHQTNMVLLVGSPYHSIYLLWIQRQHFPSCWIGFKAVPLTRCVTHTKFAKLLLSCSLLICENRVVPAFQNYFKGGVWQWMRGTSVIVGPQNEIDCFLCDPMHLDGLSSVSYMEERLWNNNSLLIWCFVHPATNGGLLWSLLLPDT